MIAWPTVAYAAWKIATFFTEAKQRINTTVGQINLMATNHFPHMEASLAKQDGLLVNIDKNIERLADKL